MRALKALQEGFLYILVGGIIDFLQLVFGLALAGVFSLPGFIPIIGPLLDTVTTPTGVALGYILDFCFSVGGGTLLITLLVFGKRFYPATLFGGFFAEAIPFVNMLPCWTAVAYRCSYKKVKAQEREAARAHLQTKKPQEVPLYGATT